MKKRRRWMVWCSVGLLGAALVSCGDDDGGDGGAASDGGGGGGDVTATTVEVPAEGLQASEIGVSAEEIRVAVVADVENPAAPGLFQGSVNGVRAWADYVNAQGGLAGRTVVVDFIDSKLSDSEARNAVIKACEEDFVLLGTSALFLTNVDDLTGCVDQAGNATGIPDIPVVPTEVVHQCSEVSFPINPPQLDCSTKDDSPQTYRTNVGRIFYYLEEFGDLQGAFLSASDIRSANNAGKILAGGVKDAGVEGVADFDVSGLAPQSAYTPIVQQIKEEQATYAYSSLPFSAMVSLRKEAKIQGVQSVEVWDCTLQCYDPRLVEQGGGDVEDTYVSLQFLPFEEADTNETLARYLEFVGDGNEDGFGVQAFAGGILLGQVVDGIVEEQGANGLTRQAVLDGLESVTEFDANGMIGVTNIAERVGTPCVVVLQVQGGEFERVFPEEEGALDCDERNLARFELDLDL